MTNNSTALPDEVMQRFDPTLSVDEAWARVQAMCEQQVRRLSVVNIYELSLHSFVIFNKAGGYPLYCLS
jgi:hypothetical protein